MSEKREKSSAHDSAPEAKEMSFWEHLEELRLTLFACLSAFALAALASGFFYKSIFAVLRFPLERAAAGTENAALAEATREALTSMHFTDPFSILFYIAFLGGIVISGPFVLYRIARFVAPALTFSERRKMVPICAASTLLFVAGGLVAFFWLAPLSIRFMYFFSGEMGLQVNWLAADYYKFIVVLVLFVGALFEFPLLVIALQYLELVSSKTLLRKWRWVLAGILIAIAFVSPVSDPVALLGLTGILFLLYLGAVGLGDLLLRRKLAARAADEAAFDAEFAVPTENERGNDEAESAPAVPVKDDENGDLRVL